MRCTSLCSQVTSYIRTGYTNTPSFNIVIYASCDFLRFQGKHLSAVTGWSLHIWGFYIILVDRCCVSKFQIPKIWLKREILKADNSKSNIIAVLKVCKQQLLNTFRIEWTWYIYHHTISFLMNHQKYSRKFVNCEGLFRSYKSINCTYFFSAIATATTSYKRILLRIIFSKVFFSCSKLVFFVTSTAYGQFLATETVDR